MLSSCGRDASLTSGHARRIGWPKGYGQLLGVRRRAGRWGRLGVVNRLEQCQRVEADPRGDPLHALERQVALASLDAAHVGAVDAQGVGESLLAQATGTAVGQQVAANGSL